MAKKKPDQVADNPNILPYASNVGAPVIKPTDLTSFKQEKILKTNDYFNYWSQADNTILSQADYNELFVESDALILDSVSFAVEYLYLEKLLQDYY